MAAFSVVMILAIIWSIADCIVVNGLRIVPSAKIPVEYLSTYKVLEFSNVFTVPLFIKSNSFSPSLISTIKFSVGVPIFFS